MLPNMIATWTGWLTEAEADEAFDVLCDLRGRRPCAVEMKRNGTQRLLRLLFDVPRLIQPWCLMQVGIEKPRHLPAYVAQWERH